jgi:hypothetical protein
MCNRVYCNFIAEKARSKDIEFDSVEKKRSVKVSKIEVTADAIFQNRKESFSIFSAYIFLLAVRTN